MKVVLRIGVLSCLFIGVAFTASAGSVYGGIGYGPQDGDHDDGQRNGILDIGYRFAPVVVWHRLELSVGVDVAWMWSDDDDDEVFAVSLVPAAHFRFWTRDRFDLYATAAVGPTLLTESQLGDQELGGKFAFNDLLGLECRFGEQREWALTLGWRHFSNAGLFEPNDGFDVPCYLMLGRKI